MRSRRTSRVLACIGAASLGVSAWAGPVPAPRDYVARLDGAPTVAVAADGRTWSVWAYRASGEFDIAVAVREANGNWGPTAFLGHREGLDQVDPAVAIDAGGNVYVAFATRAPQRVFTAVLSAGQTSWSEPALASSEAGTTPALRIVRDRIVLAYRTARGIQLIEFPIVVAMPDGISDGPDTTGPMGSSDTKELPTGGSGTPPPPPPPPDDGPESPA